MVKSQKLLNDYDVCIENNNLICDDKVDIPLNTLNDGINNDIAELQGPDAFFSSTNINDYSSAADENENDSDASYDESTSDDDSDDSDSSSGASDTDGELSFLLFEQRFNNNNNASPASKKLQKRQLQNKILRQQQRRKFNAHSNSNKELLAIASQETKRLRQWRIIVFVTITLLGAIGTTLIHLYSSGNNKRSANKVNVSTNLYFVSKLNMVHTNLL
jgi:hypothetical protein